MKRRKRLARISKAKEAVLLAYGIPEKYTEVLPVKVGENLKEAVKAVSRAHNQSVSEFVREVLKRDLKERYRL